MGGFSYLPLHGFVQLSWSLFYRSQKHRKQSLFNEKKIPLLLFTIQRRTDYVVMNWLVSYSIKQ